MKELSSLNIVTNFWFFHPNPHTHPQTVPLISAPLSVNGSSHRLRSRGHLDTPLSLIPSPLPANPENSLLNVSRIQTFLLHICSNLVTNLHASPFFIIKSVLREATRVNLYYLFITPHFVHQIRPHRTLRWLLISLRIKFKVLKQHACKTQWDVSRKRNVLHLKSLSSLLRCQFLRDGLWPGDITL